MKFGIRSNSQLERELKGPGFSFLSHSLSALTRLLPHTQTSGWAVAVTQSAVTSAAVFEDNNRRGLKLTLALRGTGTSWVLTGELRRLRVPAGIGAVSRTINSEEKDIAHRVIKAIEGAFVEAGGLNASVLNFFEEGFDERVVADYLRNHASLGLDIGAWFKTLRRLSEQTYENSALAIGCFVDVLSTEKPDKDAQFPDALLKKKKYRALSDGYRTAYEISRNGAIKGLVDLRGDVPSGQKYYPLWTEDLAAKSQRGNLSFCLTRQGDILVFEAGNLKFSYRFGRWQYWNHGHIVDLIRNAIRGRGGASQRSLGAVVNKLYRVALDVAFRRSGGLFVLLSSRASLHSIVRQGDAVGDERRLKMDAVVDAALHPLSVLSHKRSVLTELTSLDGAVVVSTRGDVLAYGAVLEPRKRHGVHKEEGSRTKAALGASNYGVAIKVSSDGDISVFRKGSYLIKV